jgi:hypothetical protein
LAIGAPAEGGVAGLADLIGFEALLSMFQTREDATGIIRGRVMEHRPK